MLHSDQGSQFTDQQWHAFLKSHGIVCSMSRRGNCHDNEVAESFFQLARSSSVNALNDDLTRTEARSDVFDYIEMFYNPKRHHSFNSGVSPVEFERQAILSGSQMSTEVWSIQFRKNCLSRFLAGQNYHNYCHSRTHAPYWG